MNQKAVWFIAMTVGRREHGVWLLNRRWLLFKFNEVKKGKLIDCRHMWRALSRALSSFEI